MSWISPPRTARLLGKDGEDFGLQDVAAGDEEVGGRVRRLGLFHHAGNGKSLIRTLAARHDAVARSVGRVDFLDADNVAAGVFVSIHHLLHDARLGLEHHVRQQQGEGLVAHQFAGAPDGVAEAERLLLAGKARLPRLRQFALQFIERFGLAAAGERMLELELFVEMVLDDALVAAGDEDKVLDPGFARLVHGILDERSVDDCQHFLGHGLGGRQETGAETGNWKHGSSDALGQGRLRGRGFSLRLFQHLNSSICTIKICR